jgi:hypothetical protein
MNYNIIALNVDERLTSYLSVDLNRLNTVFFFINIHFQHYIYRRRRPTHDIGIVSTGSCKQGRGRNRPPVTDIWLAEIVGSVLPAYQLSTLGD